MKPKFPKFHLCEIKVFGIKAGGQKSGGSKKRGAKTVTALEVKDVEPVTRAPLHCSGAAPEIFAKVSAEQLFQRSFPSEPRRPVKHGRLGEERASAARSPYGRSLVIFSGYVQRGVQVALPLAL